LSSRSASTANERNSIWFKNRPFVEGSARSTSRHSLQYRLNLDEVCSLLPFASTRGPRASYDAVEHARNGETIEAPKNGVRPVYGYTCDRNFFSCEKGARLENSFLHPHCCLFLNSCSFADDWTVGVRPACQGRWLEADRPGIGRWRGDDPSHQFGTLRVSQVVQKLRKRFCEPHTQAPRLTISSYCTTNVRAGVWVVAAAAGETDGVIESSRGCDSERVASGLPWHNPGARCRACGEGEIGRERYRNIDGRGQALGVGLGKVRETVVAEIPDKYRGTTQHPASRQDRKGIGKSAVAIAQENDKAPLRNPTDVTGGCYGEVKFAISVEIRCGDPGARCRQDIGVSQGEISRTVVEENVEIAGIVRGEQRHITATTKSGRITTDKNSDLTQVPGLAKPWELGYPDRFLAGFRKPLWLAGCKLLIRRGRRIRLSWFRVSLIEITKAAARPWDQQVVDTFHRELRADGAERFSGCKISPRYGWSYPARRREPDSAKWQICSCRWVILSTPALTCCFPKGNLRPFDSAVLWETKMAVL
jgi:hypothetical protein